MGVYGGAAGGGDDVQARGNVTEGGEAWRDGEVVNRIINRIINSNNKNMNMNMNMNRGAGV